jgi:hypothetical protein
VRGDARRGWVVYAAVLTTAVVIGELSNLARGEPFTLMLVADWMVTLVLLIATWGYALQRPVATPSYWRAAFSIVALASVLMMVRVALASQAALVASLILMAFVLPAYFAAWRYSFRSAHLWTTSVAPFARDSPGS